MPNILIVEDEDIIRTSLCKLLTREGFDVETARNVQDAQQYPFADFDLIISDLRLPGGLGTDLINMVDNTPVLIMTSYASLRSAVDTMRMGAVDYIPKPFDHGEMLNVVRRIINERARQPQSTEYNSPSHASRGMVGNSPAMKKVFNIIHKVAQTDATVLILGETGTGKELAAQAIHNESPRHEQPLISVNCAAIPETLIEAELFGHEKGAFTGASEARVGLIAAADGGTLFLDEIGELPLEAQARLLRVLQEGEVRPIGSITSRKVDVRLVAATHRNLKQLCTEGKFREDLYYRINVVNLDIPALRERGKDILAITDMLLAKFCQKFDRPSLKLAMDAVQAVTSYHWPGNIRQLENSLQRAVILCDNDREISHELLGIDLSLVEQPITPNNMATAAQANATQNQAVSLEDYFTQFVLNNQEHMSETELAKQLGISRKCLWERRQKMGIPRQKNELTTNG